MSREKWKRGKKWDWTDEYMIQEKKRKGKGKEKVGSVG